MKTKEMNTNELLTLASRSTQNALKMVAHNNQFVTDLMNQMNHDNSILNPAHKEYRATATAENLERLEELTEERAESHKARKRITTSAEDRAKLDEYIAQLNAEICDTRGHNKDMDSAEDNTISDRQDCVQVWILTYKYSTPSQKVIDSTVKMLSESTGNALFMLTEYTLADIYEVAKIRNAKNAVCNYVRQQAGLNALDTVKTDKVKASKAEVIQWLHRTDNTLTYTDSHGITTTERNIWERYPLNATTTRALEIDEDGNYIFVDRSYTFKQCASIYTTDKDGNEVMRHSNNTLVQNRADLDYVQWLNTCEQLTQRERRYIRAYFTIDADRAGAKARAQYYLDYADSLGKYDRKAFFEGLEKAEENGRKEHALTVLGLDPSTSTARSFIQRLRKNASKLQRFDPNTTPYGPQEPPTDSDTMRRYMESNRGTHNGTPTPSADLIKWTDNAPRRTVNAVQWLTAEQAQAQRERREQEQAHKWRVTDPTEEQAQQNANAYTERHKNDPQRTAETVRGLSDEDRAKHYQSMQERLAKLEKMEQWENRHR